MLLQAQQAQLILLDWQSQQMGALADKAGLLQRARALQQLAAIFAVPSCSAQLPEAFAGAWLPELVRQADTHITRSPYSAACEVAHSVLPLIEAAAKPAPKGNARSLPKHLQKAQAEPRNDLGLAGCYTHTAVLQTALELLDNEDYSLIIVLDCCASPRQRDHDAALDRLAAQGAELVSLEMLALEWLADTDSRHAEAVHGLLAALPS